ncbi:MAG: putative 2OG-Fe(II) oxygenase [Wenzhouxiangella sp.]
MLEIQPTFAVPLAFARRSTQDGLNHDLRELFLKKEAEGARFANPSPYTQRNEALFESHFDLFKWEDPPIRKLRQFCWDRLMELVAKINGYDADFLRRIRIGTDAWFHITRRHGYFSLHNHPMASWSGVYCVSGGQHDAESASSGNLTFINPFVMNTMFVDAGTAQMRPPFDMSSRTFQLQAGQLVLFPSWLLHEVKPFTGEGERITVAFNTWFHVAAEENKS